MNYFQFTNPKDSKKVFIVAEVGINHNGDMDLARDSIHAAASAGADAVKFQNYRTNDFINKKDLIFEYTSQGKIVSESQYDMFKRCELSRDQLSFLKQQCDEAGVLFHSTPTSLQGIHDLQELDCRILKNGSDYLTNLDLIKAMGETGLFTILSTGMATISEIDSAVSAFRQTGNNNLMLLHCTSSYPTPSSEVNLNRIATLRKAFGVDVGFSDHTNGTIAAVGATMFGVRWIEKHFTLSKSLPGPDHWFSMDPQELANLVSDVRNAEQMLGDCSISPTASENEGRRQFRLSCVASRDLEIGTILSSEDVTFQRPGDGISPIHKDSIIGLQLFHPLTAGQQILKKHFVTIPE